MTSFFVPGPLELLIIGVICVIPTVMAAVVAVVLLSKQRQAPTVQNLQPCPDCSHPVSPKAERCPKCGRPLST